MISTANHPVHLSIGDRLRKRLAELGVTVGLIEPDGTVYLADGARPLERLIAQSRPFAVALRQALPELRARSGEAVTVWPGLWLAPLTSERRRRVAVEAPEPLLVAVLLGPELLVGDQLRLVCDSQRVDYRATVAAVRPEDLVGPGEARRLAAALTWLRQDTVEVDRRVTELHTMSQQLAESYEELSLLYKLSSGMTVDQPPSHFLNDACRELQQVAGLTWMALQVSSDDQRLNELAGGLFTAAPEAMDKKLLTQVGQWLIAHAPAKATVYEEPETAGIPRLAELAANVLVVPLVQNERVIGVLFGGDKLDGSRISSIDSKLCHSLANTLSIFLQNLMLYEDMQAMFLGTLHALTSSIDAKDSYTHGHSERVALMSRQLAEAVGLDEHQVERVYVSGLVHDVGKIGVPESVLCKAGPLTDEEFGMIKMHPQIGARILQDIRQMQDLIPGVLYHHERWDGQGYPFGLSGQDIPIFGRLIGLADAFDAMSSNRTYRSAMPLQQVLGEIRRCAGSQFDPTLVEHFTRLDFDPFYRLIEKHHAASRKRDDAPRPETGGNP